MNNSALNLRRLFAFPDPAATTSPSNQWQEFQSRLGREIKTIKWPAAMPDLASKIGELFNVELPDLFVSSWKKATEPSSRSTVVEVSCTHTQWASACCIR